MEDADVALFESALDDNGDFIGGEPAADDIEAIDTPELDGEPEAEPDADPEADDDAEVDPEADPEAEPEGEPEADPEEEEEKLIELEIGDDVYEVNLEELKSGYIRNEEFVARQVELEDQHAAKLEQVEQTRAQLLEEIEAYAVTALSNANSYDQVNWAQLKQQDPERFAQLRLEALEAREQAQAVIQRRANIRGMQQEAQRLKHEAYVKTQAELAKKLIPELSTDEEFGAKLIKYGKEVGYSEDDIRSIADARQLAVLNDARLWRESQARRKGALEKLDTVEVKPVLKPGAATPKTNEATKKVKASHQRLKKEQSIEAAADFFLNSNFV
ncbi:head scaffolding protein [Pseudomonas phage Bjorn]|uniref:Scaffold protein n=1 Tax=Pseudomonas phage Bjorn TaxID=2079288 RepID=A0A2K9VHF4_9CAUD|nr:head scaffolding protein [Pseudomonas phage Bjorn]AUV61750.1 scaffold protein [Pseudomonas phage Bjorn]